MLSENRLLGEKERLINMFFNIGRNQRTKSLKACLSECERYLLFEESEEIRDLVHIIHALIIYFEKNDKEEAKKWVIDLWNELKLKSDFLLYEIRIINTILFVESDIKKVIEIVEKCLKQLEIYKFHEKYLIIKISMKLNLVIILTDCKFFDNQYKVEYDDLIYKITKEVISLNVESKLNNKLFVATSTIYRGILLKDKELIYIGFLMLKDDTENYENVEELVKMYIKKYNIEM